MYEISMPYEESSALKNFISRSSNILEYGAGGSTFFSLKNRKKVVSVETSKEYILNIKNFDTDNNLTTVYVDVGETKEWGYSKNLDHSVNWFHQYSEKPWKIRNDYDFVLIDGRFRVLSFISSWNNSQPGTIIFWDDFKYRNHYHGVLAHVTPPYFVGRAAVFTKNENNPVPESFISRYVADQR